MKAKAEETPDRLHRKRNDQPQTTRNTQNEVTRLSVPFGVFCVFRGSHPISRKMTNHGMHGIHGNEEIGFRCTGKIKLDTEGVEIGHDKVVF